MTPPSPHAEPNGPAAGDERFLLLASNAPIGIFQSDANGRCLFVNPAWCQLAGMTPEQAQGDGWLTALHPEDRARVLAGWEAAVRRGEPSDAEFRFRRPDGGIVWLQGRAMQCRDRTGAVTGHVGVVADITQRRRGDDATRRLAAIVESSDDAIVSSDLEGSITSWNRGAELLYGYASAEITGRPVSLLIPPDRPDEGPGILHRIRRGEHIESYETVRLRKDGSLVDVSLTVSPLKDVDGNIVGASKIARDITARKQAEAGGEGQRRVLHLIARDAPLEEVLAELMRTAERVASGRMFACFMLLVDGRLRSCAAPSLPAAYTAAMDGLVAGPDAGSCGSSAWLKAPVYVADIATDPRWAPSRDLALSHGLRACWSTPALSASGEVLGTFAMYYPEPREPTPDDLRMVDLVIGTAAIAIENKRAAAALRTSEAQLRLVTDNAPVLLVRTDRQHRYTFVNRAYAERNGFTAEAMIGMSVADAVGEKAYESFRHQMDLALAGQQVEFEMEIPYTRIGRRWVHVVYVPERNATGKITGLLGVITDIGTRKEAEIELKRARDEALAASQTKDEFLAALSHELRTPLNPVLLVASSAAANPELPPAVRADFELIRKNVDLEARLIDDLLDLTRITRGKLLLEKRPCDVHLVLRDAVANVQADLREKRLRLILRLEAAASAVMGDSVRLQQVFWNILKNAVKFTPENGEVAVETNALAGVLAVRITDTGIGMTPDEMNRAFQAFAQGDHAGSGTGQHRFGGLGLGLAISKMLVEAHAGRITALSGGRNHGSTIIVELPLSAQSAGDSPPATKTGSSSPLGSPGRSRYRRILLVEDHAATRRTLQHLLVQRHYKVTTADSASHAHGLALMGDFDLIISDLGLPDRNGYELMAGLRALNPRLAGIALSGYGMEEDLLRSREAGFSIHLVKPVTIEMLEEAIARLPQSPAEAPGPRSP